MGCSLIIRLNFWFVSLLYSVWCWAHLTRFPFGRGCYFCPNQSVLGQKKQEWRICPEDMVLSRHGRRLPGTVNLMFVMSIRDICIFCYFCRLNYSNTYKLCQSHSVHAWCHFSGSLQKDHNLSLKLAYKAPVGSVVSPIQETAFNEHHPKHF